MDCIICAIVEGRLPAQKIYEDKDNVAFLDSHPAAPGHTLLVPKAHVARIEELTNDEAKALFQVLHKLLEPIRTALSADATTIGINNGPGSGQEIRHIHIHIIPRHRGDHGGIIQSIGPGGKTDPMDAAEKIRARLL